MQSSKKIYTIGHSDRSIDIFFGLLKKYGIGILVDIRAYPYSSRFPHFSEQGLREQINKAGIDYHWAGKQLGGMRKPINTDSHPALPSESFRGFAEYMETGEFQRAVGQLQNLSGKSPTVIMCAEKVASNCHRSLISDYLTIHQMEVEHILDETTSVIHSLSELARTESSELIYDRNTSGSLFS